PDVRAIRYDAAAREVVFEDPLLPLRVKMRPGGEFVPPERFNLPPTPMVLNYLYWYAKRLSKNQHMLLVGETAAGKTAQMQFSHRLLNAALYYTNLSSQSSEEEIGGGWGPDPERPGHFKYIPGLLERAGEAYDGEGAAM